MRVRGLPLLLLRICGSVKVGGGVVRVRRQVGGLLLLVMLALRVADPILEARVVLDQQFQCAGKRASLGTLVTDRSRLLRCVHTGR